MVLLGVDHSYGSIEDRRAKTYGGTTVDSGEKDLVHFRPDYNPKNINYHVDLNAMERGYNLANISFKKDKRRILNASPGTKLEVYSKIDYDSIF